MPLRSFVRADFCGRGRESVGERGDEAAEFIGPLDDERLVERGEHRRQPVEPLRTQFDAEPTSGLRVCGPRAGAPPRSRRWREAGCGSARLSPGSAASLDACTEPWRARTGRAVPDRVRGAARTSRAGSWRPRCGLAVRSGPRRSGICARNVPAARVGDRPVGCKVRSLDRIITGDVARLVGFYEKARAYGRAGPMRTSPSSGRCPMRSACTSTPVRLAENPR